MKNDDDWIADEWRLRCRCGGDMPGRCPGPAACPMCEQPEEEEDDEECAD